jgi:hypothetical protein
MKGSSQFVDCPLAPPDSMQALRATAPRSGAIGTGRTEPGHDGGEPSFFRLAIVHREALPRLPTRARPERTSLHLRPSPVRATTFTHLLA